MKRSFQPGLMDRRVTLQSVSSSVNSVGQPVETFTTAAIVWAKVEQVATEEEREGADAVNRQRIKITIRYYPTLANNWQVIYEGRTYRIIGAPVEIGRKQYQEITAEYTGVFASA